MTLRWKLCTLRRLEILLSRLKNFPSELSIENSQLLADHSRFRVTSGFADAAHTSMPPIKLAFREHGRGAKTVVILHGLLGSSQNWQRAAQAIGEQYRVLVVDQRNHGESPHTATHSFAEMCGDLEQFFDEHGLQRAYVLGHSMGGGTAMEFAFRHPLRLQGLMIEDIAPRAYGTSTMEILDGLAAINLPGLRSRQQADAELAKTIPSTVVRQFLLTNLVRNEDLSFSWKMNLPVLQSAQRELAGYRPPENARYDGETLFIGGEQSAYRIDQDELLIKRHFPNSCVQMIPNAGHWLHFEALQEFTAIVKRFMSEGLERFR